MSMKSTSTWFALRNPVFCRLWLASVLSGTIVSTQDTAATWLMHVLALRRPCSLSWQPLHPLRFFLFTLPAGAFADIANRRTVIISAVLWQGVCVALLALGAFTKAINPNAVLASIFMIGIGLVFGAPVWGAIVPDVVSKEELSSAITLGGMQVNLSGIIGPALG